MQFRKIILIVSIYSLSIVNANGTSKDNLMLVHYYKSFYNNYQHPFKGKDELSFSEAEKLTNYYIEEKNSKGNVISFKKILNNSCFFEFNYQYDHNDNLIKVIQAECK